MKKIVVKLSISLLFVATIILGFNSNTVEASKVEISVNNHKLKFQESLESPYLDSNSRMMIPLRTISEELGHKAEMLFDSDLNIFPELNLTMDDLPGGFYIAESNIKETFKLRDSTKYNIIYNNNIMGEDVTKHQFINAVNNGSMYTGYFIIETKNNYITSIREIYHP